MLPLAVTTAASGYQGMVKQVPIGAVSLISPFNFPLNLTAHKIAPAIAAGCPFVLKPASLTQISALKIAEILAETDLPKGAFSVLPCPRELADVLGTDCVLVPWGHNSEQRLEKTGRRIAHSFEELEEILIHL